MIIIYGIDEKEQWNNEVKSYNNWDVYYLYEYAYSFKMHGDGEPILICYSDENIRLCLVAMKSDIGKSNKFIHFLNEDEYYDLETPYGYGGPLTDSVEIPEKSQLNFLVELKECCAKEKIVSLFIRFDSTVIDHNIMPMAIESRYLRDTIYIDTTDKELILKNMDPKCRNMFRKAEKSGIVIKKEPIDNIDSFIKIYNKTMEMNNADDYYYFSEEYYKALADMKENAAIYYAYMNDEAVSAAIILYNNAYMHYHLSGTLPEYRKYSPGNLLLYTAACDATDMGISRFHLGGGMAPDDSLFGFKKQFNRNGNLPFFVGRIILDEKRYNKLLDIREQSDISFDRNNNRMIQYRT